MGVKSENSESFGIVLRELREAAGLTQEQLGFESDLRRTFISVLELGQQQPSLTTVFKLASALRISASDMVRRVEVRILLNVTGYSDLS